jgi:hypothetical protein
LWCCASAASLSDSFFSQHPLELLRNGVCLTPFRLASIRLNSYNGCVHCLISWVRTVELKIIDVLQRCYISCITIRFVWSTSADYAIAFVAAAFHYSIIRFNCRNVFVFIKLVENVET